MTKAQKITPDIGKFLEDKMGSQHAIDSTYSQQPIPSPIKFVKLSREHKCGSRHCLSRGIPSTTGLPPIRRQIPSPATKKLSVLAKAILEASDSSETRICPRKLWHLRTGYCIRSTPYPWPTGNLCPTQTPPAGIKLARGLGSLSSLLKALRSESCLNYLDRKPFSRISRGGNFLPQNNPL